MQSCKQQADPASVQESGSIKPNNSSIDSAFNNSYRDINNFSISTGNAFADSLHSAFSKAAELTSTGPFCYGDNCETYQTWVNKEDSSIFYFFKNDQGEYGFSNDQYYFKNDSLRCVRNYKVQFEIWPADSNSTALRIEETIYMFHDQAVTCFKKNNLTTEFTTFNFKLEGIKAEPIKVDYKEIYAEKIEELKNLLAKNSEDEE